MKITPSACLLGLLFLAAPASLAVAELPWQKTGKVYVVNNAGDDLSVYDTGGNYLYSFTDPGGVLDGPRGIAFTAGGDFFVASQNTDEIFHFDKYEQYLTRFGATQLNGPTGMSISNDGTELYVGSYDNDRVVVFDLDGNYLRQFNGGGLNGTNCVTFDPAGNIYVSSALTNRVLKFDSNENFLFSFTGGGLASPMSIARNTSGVLYVSGGGSNNIVKFDTSGNLLGTISHPDLPVPQGIAFDDQGHFFCSSFSTPRMVEFDENDAWVQTVTGSELSVPRSLALRPLGAAVPASDGWSRLLFAGLVLGVGIALLSKVGARRRAAS